MIKLPKVIAGTSSLGNLYEALPFEQKKQIVNAYITTAGNHAVFDSAGKYGAGLALESLAECLHELGVGPQQVTISNKLGWFRTELTGAEPTFEPGIWKDLKYDAIQRISYNGIMECFEQGNKLLGDYAAQMVSVHDPDEYLAASADEQDGQQRYSDILEAYRALHDLKRQGHVQSVGVGAKDWRVIERISKDVSLDWVMFANSLTIYQHPGKLLSFVNDLAANGVAVINSAVFHGGFLTGSNFFNYRPVSRNNQADSALFDWRDKFYSLCSAFNIKPAAACVYFAKHIPGITSIALNSTSPQRTKSNVEMVHEEIPPAFWREMKEIALLKPDYPYL